MMDLLDVPDEKPKKEPPRCLGCKDEVADHRPLAHEKGWHYCEACYEVCRITPT